MTREQIEIILKNSLALLDKENGYALPEGSSATVHVAHDGASLGFTKLESLKFEGDLLYGKGSKQTVVMVVSDVFAIAIEGGGPGQARRPAGF